MTLRDELAALLGPGNNDQIAYEQTDAVLEVLDGFTWTEILAAINEAVQRAKMWAEEYPPVTGDGGEQDA